MLIELYLHRTKYCGLNKLIVVLPYTTLHYPTLHSIKNADKKETAYKMQQ